MVIRSVGVLSVGKVLGCLYALIGLLAGGFFTLFSMTGLAAAGGQPGRAEALIFGAGAIVIFPVMYGVMGFIGGVISAAFYNIIANMIGGIEIDLRE